MLIALALAAAQVSAPPQGPSHAPSPAVVAPAAHAGGDHPVEQAPRRVPGYLGAGATPDAWAVLPPPPTAGSTEPAELVDRRAFEVTQKLKGTSRWELARSDADESAAAVLAGFDCVFGIDLNPRTAPALTRLLTRVRSDAGPATTPPKERFQHWRPFVSYGGEICTPGDKEREGTARSWSYPSGHTHVGWAFGLVLAELAPDLATPIFQRARVFGESRVVCGVHTVSDIEGGRVNASMTVAALHANAEFKADLEAARLELAALRAQGGNAPPATQQCAAIREAMERTPWLPAKVDRPRAQPPKALPKPLPKLRWDRVSVPRP